MRKIKIYTIILLFTYACDSKENEAGFMRTGKAEYKLISKQVVKYPVSIDTAIYKIVEGSSNSNFKSTVVLEYLKPIKKGEEAENKDSMYIAYVVIDNTTYKLLFNQDGIWMNKNNWRQMSVSK